MLDKSPLKQLYDRDLPGMVRWYDPRLLAGVFVRTVVSSTFGQYADQRLIQAATDEASRDELIKRHDYSDPDCADPEQRIHCDPSGAFWVDYVADCGDGFEPTYTMAYLMAKDKLEAGASEPLSHGSILIMGGDQCYPQATREDYRKRLQLPYGWAFNVPNPQRKLFAIPGNHDWYDGLAAFDSLFCAARDKLSDSKGNTIGGWQCVQHRSYWAMRLPHNWWIWGADIQFSKYLDSAQVNYFETIARQMGPDHKLIICLAEPSWLLADAHGQDEEQNFFKITAIARKYGAKVCAVIAGDSHHYARYSSADLGVHFFTSGGGGSFLHPTHVLKNEVEVHWPERKTDAAPPVNPVDAQITQGWAPQSYDVRLKRPKKGENVVEEVVGEVMREGLPPSVDPRRARKPLAPLKQRAPKCYPPRGRSLVLSLRNLLFPFYNFPFAIGIGLIYWIVTWQFHSVVRQYDISAGKIDQAGLDVPVMSLVPWMPVYVLQATLSIGFVSMLALLYFVLVSYVQAPEKPGAKRLFVKFTVGTTHFLAHMFAMFTLFLVFLAFNNNLAPWITSQIGAVMQSADQQPQIVREIVKETLEPLSQRRQAQRELGTKQERTSRPAPPPTPPAVGGEKAEPNTIREIVGLLYPIEMTLTGAFIGGFIWGAYWVFAGLLGRMHAEDAFAALRIKDYKNFLRLKFEPDQVTIFPIGVDRIPRRTDWMSAPDSRAPDGQNAALIPTKPIQVHLIEAPIVIRPDDVRG